MLKCKTFILLLAILSCSIISELKAQAHAQAAMRTHMQAVRTHEQMTRQFQHMNLMMMNGQKVKKFQEKYKFNIVTLNGDTILNKKKITVSFSKPIKEIMIKYKKEKNTYTPDQTKEIYLKQSGRIVTGIPYNDYWIFNMHSTGNLKLYAPFPEKDITYAAFYQMPGDSIKMITEEFVTRLVAGNLKAEKQLKKRKVLKALEIYIKEENKKK
ncbi:MAG: hypothetical protein ACK5KT_17390 [Dysgonomonas sp.]